MYCTGLHSLRLESEEQTPRNLRSLLRAVGPTLESFMMVDESESGYGALDMADLMLVHNMCPHLSRITIKIKDCLEWAYVDFLCSYGAQLRSAILRGMSKEAFEQVMEQCPNLRATFSLHTTEDSTYLQKVPALALAKTEVLHVKAEEPLSQQDLENATRDCVTVESIDLQGKVRAATVAVKGLFGFDKPKLKSFRLRVSSPDIMNELFAVDEQLDAVQDLRELGKTLQGLGSRAAYPCKFVCFHGGGAEEGSISRDGPWCPVSVRGERLSDEFAYGI